VHLVGFYYKTRSADSLHTTQKFNLLAENI